MVHDVSWPETVLTTLSKNAAPRILVLGDAEDGGANVIPQFLRGMGVKIDVAEDSFDAIERAWNVDYALIVLNISLPAMEGAHVAKAIRRGGQSILSPVLFVVASTFDREHALMEFVGGPVDFITRPVNITILRSKARHYAQTFQPHDSEDIHDLKSETDEKIVNEAIFKARERAAKPGTVETDEARHMLDDLIEYALRSAGDSDVRVEVKIPDHADETALAMCFHLDGEGNITPSLDEPPPIARYDKTGLGLAACNQPGESMNRVT